MSFFRDPFKIIDRIKPWVMSNTKHTACVTCVPDPVPVPAINIWIEPYCVDNVGHINGFAIASGISSPVYAQIQIFINNIWTNIGTPGDPIVENGTIAIPDMFGEMEDGDYIIRVVGSQGEFVSNVFEFTIECLGDCNGSTIVFDSVTPVCSGSQGIEVCFSLFSSNARLQYNISHWIQPIASDPNGDPWMQIGQCANWNADGTLTCISYGFGTAAFPDWPDNGEYRIKATCCGNEQTIIEPDPNGPFTFIVNCP